MTGGFIVRVGEYLSILNFIIDIVINYIPNTTDHPITTSMQMNIEILSDAMHDGKSLSFKRMSPSEWKSDRIVELWVSRLLQLYVILLDERLFP